jgi:hypothetical protein
MEFTVDDADTHLYCNVVVIFEGQGNQWYHGRLLVTYSQERRHVPPYPNNPNSLLGAFFELSYTHHPFETGVGDHPERSQLIIRSNYLSTQC